MGEFTKLVEEVDTYRVNYEVQNELYRVNLVEEVSKHRVNTGESVNRRIR